MALERRAVRGLLVTPEEEVLLMRVHYPWIEGEMWIAPGGGLRRGESAEQALVREMHEETGLALSDVGPVVWRREQLWDHVEPPVLQREQFFLLRGPRFEPRTEGLREGRERDWFGGYRWWPIHGLPERDPRFAPTRIGELLRGLLREGAPGRPVEIGS